MHDVRGTWHLLPRRPNERDSAEAAVLRALDRALQAENKHVVRVGFELILNIHRQ
jgi:hypothetical protein